MNHGSFTFSEHERLDQLESGPLPDRVHAAATVVDDYFLSKHSRQRALGGAFDWRNDIDTDPDYFNIECPMWCVAGQIGPEGDYYEFLDSVNETLGEVAYLTAKLGFDTTGSFAGTQDQEARGLEMAWRTYLEVPT